MAVIDVATISTVGAIASAREAKNQQWDSIGLSMSELGSECDRALWFSFRWASQHERLDGQKLRLFETGHIEEARMISDLRMVEGIEVEDLDPATSKQHKVYAIGGHVRGKLDGLVQGLIEAPKVIHVLECKSHNDKSFKELTKKKLQKAKTAHWLQCQFYMHLKQLTRCLYYAVNKDKDAEYQERIEYDPVAVMRMLVRLERIIGSNQAPSRISEDQKALGCLLCKHKAVCSKSEFGRNHCRTCLHATPIIDKEDTAATWLCERHNKTLSADEQRAGCGSHLFLPDVVPGKQTDVGDDFVVYVMRDGSQWIDQEKQPEPTIRYWWHPESELLWTTDDGSSANGGSEELTAEQYAEAQAYLASVAS